MTCIVALCHQGKVYVGGDAASTNVWSLGQSLTLQPKVFEKSEMVIGCAGSPRQAQIVRYHTDFSRRHPDMDGHEYLVNTVAETIRHTLKSYDTVITKDGVDSIESNFIVAHGDRLYTIYSDMAVIEAQTPYAAIGSGQDLALGSLHTSPVEMDPIQRLTKALEAAAAFNAGVRAPFTIKTFGDVAMEAA